MEVARKVAGRLLERFSVQEAKAMVWEALQAGRIDGYQAVAILAWME